MTLLETQKTVGDSHAMSEKLPKTHDEIGNEMMANFAMDDALDALHNAISLHEMAQTPELKRMAMNIVMPLRCALGKFEKFGSVPNQRFAELKRRAGQ